MKNGYDRKLLRVSTDALIIEAHRTADRLRKDNHLLAPALNDSTASVHLKLAEIADSLISIRRSINSDHIYPPIQKLLIELAQVSNNAIAKSSIIAQVNEAEASTQREGAIALIENTIPKALLILRELADKLQRPAFDAIEDESRLLNLPPRMPREKTGEPT